ncbi:MAG: polyprenyl synthetase [Acidobacteria bacterium RIFCSPLOWO2_02_FULL_59_13]|nr:MAG: polyprenyl synthetase [Acidobacteria bacterium RIFCSPLOWO2_02_FULL_59_13]
MSLDSHLEQQRKRVEQRLRQLVPEETENPPLIHRAMRYSLFAGGKRIRPILCLEAARMISPEPNSDLETISCTLEMVHTYSLIHDDLPALDNDDYRRGKPTCHKMFGEATAILAGDALLTLAFYVLSTLPHTPGEVQAALVAELSRAAGTVEGMIGGQVADLEATNRSVSPETLEYIHHAKTASLLRAAVRLGGIAEQATRKQMEALSLFGKSAGLAFQIVDDILDVESSSESLGKTAGKDAVQKKITYPALYGLERSKQIAAEFIAEAEAALDPFGERADTLKKLAQYLVSRKV